MTWHPDIPLEYRNQIVTGDARELAKRIPDESIDLILTDPPYPKDYLYLWGELGKMAARVLKPTGFLLAMSGQMYLNEVMVYLNSHLDYFWLYEAGSSGWAAGVCWPNGNTKVNIVVRCKPVLAYRVNETMLPRTSTLGLFWGSGGDKRFHKWGQDVSTFRYYADCFSSPGNVVLDPFAGGGTIPIACNVINRNYIAFEIDPETADLARERVLNTQPPLFVPEPEQLELGE